MIPLDTFKIVDGITLLKIASIIPIIISPFYINLHNINISKIKKNGSIFLVIFLFLSAFQLFFSPYTAEIVNKLETLLVHLLFIIIMSVIDFDDEEVQFLKKCFCSMSIMAVAMIPFFKYDFEGRLTLSFFGSMEDPNQFGGYLAPGLLYYFKKTFDEKKVSKKIISLIISITLLFVAFLTGSRGALLAIIISCATLYLISNKKNHLGKRAASLIMVSVLIIIVVSLINSFMDVDIIERFTVNDVAKSGGTGRMQIWEFYMDYYKNSNLVQKMFGHGLGSLSAIYRVAHNTWIDVLIGNGLIGLLLFITFFSKNLINTIKRKDELLIAQIVAIVVLTMSLSLLSYKPIWALFALISITLSKDKK